LINEHYLQRVALYRSEVISACMEYFNRFPEHIEWFATHLEELHWRNKYIGEFRNHISLTAVLLANKIFEQLNIITFPFIERVACRGWGTADGTWAWAMQDVHNISFGSADPVKYCLRKNIRLSQLDSGEICADRIVK